MRIRVPEATSLAMALAIPDDKGAGLWTCIELTEPADRWRIVERVMTAGTDVDLFDDAADRLIEKITGWKRWEAAFVWRSTLGAWPVIDGDLTMRGVDLAVVPASRVTNTVYAWWRQTLGRDENAWKKFQRDMQREPRRILEREAAKPMDPASFAMLSGAVKQASRKTRSSEVAASTITMPDPIV
ncbi:hypothetical protein JVX90_00320 [Gordonia sp. PDNC005]|uniref:hypothetical protein n=1 Tax=Gordonia sp. PDNC005 TaxID=2811424 RepID=UPI001965DD01|nr:hypothetical protein [Gordonia sp. PDNC005]QRY62757.1 hypothetical protein JVX90_00320 [Gordonia sp. PDNC005]